MCLAWPRYKAVTDRPQEKVDRQTKQGRIQDEGKRDKKDKYSEETNT